MARAMDDDLEAARRTLTPPLAEPSITNRRNPNTVERASPIPLQGMHPGSEVRQRPGPGRTVAAQVEDSGIETAHEACPTLVSTQGQNHDQHVTTEARSPVASWWAAIARIFTARTSTLSFERSAEDIEKFKLPIKGENIIREKVESFPPGFSAMAAFRNSDESFSIYRKYGFLHARAISVLEAELDVMEKQLLDIEKEYANSNLIYYLRVHKTGPEDIDRRKLLEQIYQKLMAYDKIVVKYNEMCAMGKAPARDHESLLNWISNKHPLDDPYADSVLHIDDFISVTGDPGGRSKTLAFFDNLLLDYVYKNPRSWLQNFLKSQTQTTVAQTDTDIVPDPQVSYYVTSTFDNIIKFVTVCTAVGSIMIPVSILFLVEMRPSTQLLTLFIFMAAFAFLLLVVADAKPDKLFIGTVSYGALLATLLAMNQTRKMND